VAARPALNQAGACHTHLSGCYDYTQDIMIKCLSLA